MPGDSAVEIPSDALFDLKSHRGEGMLLLAMNWRGGPPPDNFVGFAIEYREPNGTQFYPLKNRLSFEGNAGSMSSEKRPPTFSTLVAPIQKFRWVHFPRNAELPGDFIYRVTPVFMSGSDQLSYGVARTTAVQLARETYPGVLNVAFTRGFISSQAFVDNYVDHGPVNTLLPPDSKSGLSFVPTHPDTKSALAWMGFEAYRELLEVLDGALADATAEVGLIAYDLNLPDVVDRLARLGNRARVIIDNSDEHHGDGAAEDKAETTLVAAGVRVKRQKMGKLQHNKTVYVDGDVMKAAIGGSTNMSWRGLFVQSNNLLLIRTERAVSIFKQAFETYWAAPSTFKKSASAEWMGLGLAEVDARITFSPHSATNSVLKTVADDIRSATSSIFYSLAFLANTPGVIRDALGDQTGRNELFVTGISDQKAGVVVASSSSNSPPTYVAALDANAPSPFREEPTGLAKGGLGTRMHHKFIVMDFDQPGARVYLGSYNMSKTADGDNGENLIVVRDKRVATSYMIEAIRIIDHYQFRVLSKKDGKALKLKKPPRSPGETPWWDRDYKDPGKIKDRVLFCP